MQVTGVVGILKYNRSTSDLNWSITWTSEKQLQTSLGYPRSTGIQFSSSIKQLLSCFPGIVPIKIVSVNFALLQIFSFKSKLDSVLYGRLKNFKVLVCNKLLFWYVIIFAFGLVWSLYYQYRVESQLKLEAMQSCNC